MFRRFVREFGRQQRMTVVLNGTVTAVNYGFSIPPMLNYADNHEEPGSLGRRAQEGAARCGGVEWLHILHFPMLLPVRT